MVSDQKWADSKSNRGSQLGAGHPPDAGAFAATLSEDADTFTTITGQLARTFHGLGGIPQRWINGVERADNRDSAQAVRGCEWQVRLFGAGELDDADVNYEVFRNSGTPALDRLMPTIANHPEHLMECTQRGAFFERRSIDSAKDEVMSGKLDGRKILVTGAASGMGREIATLFAQEGARLALFDRNKTGLSAIATSLAMASFVSDVSDREQVNRTVLAAGESLGGLDGIINAAGILDIAAIDDLSPESWDRMIEVNLTGPFNVVKAALPFLRTADKATIVTIASVSGLMPMAGTAGYSASKGGALMFTKALAFDLGPTIRANSICPGVIKTEMTRYLWENPEHTARAEQRVALKRLGAVSDVARAALFFSTEDSGFTTGTELPVDGGFSWR